MDDLISRRQAIDATWEEPSYTDPLNVLTEVRDRIKALPPAQPESLVNESRPLVKDTISRQQVIGALRNYLVGKNVPCDGTLMARLIENEVINKLPSAQPDTGKATWAIHTYMPHNYYCTNCKQDSPYNKIWDFCPHCGFKMEDYV